MTKLGQILLFLLNIIFISGFAQEVPNSFDPIVLKDALVRAKDDSVRLEIMLRLAEFYRLEQPEKANEYYDELIDLANANGLYVFSSKAFLMKAVVEQVNSRMDSSLFYMNEAISYSEKTTDTALQIMLLNNKALLLGEVGRAYESAEILAKTIRFAKASKDTVNVVQGVTNLANLRGATEDFRGTLSLLKKEKPYWENIDEVGKAKLIFVRANCYSGLEEYEKAKADYEAIYETFKQIHNPYNYVILLNNYTNALLKTNNALEALALTNEAIIVAESINLKYGIGHALLNKAMCLYKLEAIDSAGVYTDSALHILNPTEAPSLYLLTLQTAHEISVAQGNWKIANDYNKLYIHLKDSIDKVARAMSMDSLLVSNDIEEKEEALQKAILEKQSEEEKRNTIIQWSGALLFGLSALFIFLHYRKRKRIEELAFEKEAKDKQVLKAYKQLEQKLKEIANQEKDIQKLKKKLDLAQVQAKPKEELLASADVYTILKKNIHQEGDWTLFQQYFSNANPELLTNFKAKYPGLTAHDLRLLSLVRLNLSSSEIAALFNIEPESARKSRYRLAKKLGLSGEKELHPFVMSFPS